MDQLQSLAEIGQPGQQTQVRHHRGRHGLGWCIGCRFAGRDGLQRRHLLHSGLTATRPQHRCTRRHQRGQELPKRRRQRRTPLPRHHQRRRLSRPRGQRLPFGRSQRCHHRPMRGARRALRPRLWWPFRQPFIWWCTSQPHLLCQRADGTAIIIRCLRCLESRDCPWHGETSHP